VDADKLAAGGVSAGGVVAGGMAASSMIEEVLFLFEQNCCKVKKIAEKLQIAASCCKVLKKLLRSAIKTVF